MNLKRTNFYKLEVFGVRETLRDSVDEEEEYHHVKVNDRRPTQIIPLSCSVLLHILLISNCVRLLICKN